MAEPWERQQDEPPKAFEAFVAYRDLGPQRSQVKVGKRLGVSSTLTERWAQRRSWTDRALAWDDEQDRVGREATLAEVRAMHRRHAEIAVLILNKVEARLIGNEAEGINALDPSKLTPRDLATLTDIAVKLERVARGEAAALVGIRHSGAVVRAQLPTPNDDQRTAEAIVALVEAGVLPEELLKAIDMEPEKV
jgi:hypothetical protein